MPWYLRTDGRAYYTDGETIDTPLPGKPLSVVKEEKQAELMVRFTEEVAKGFVSSALGSPHTYRTPTLEHQINIAGAGVATVSVSITCVDSAGSEAQRTHTPAQLQTMINDAAVYKADLVAQLRGRLGQVATAATAEEVQSVTW